MLSLMSTNVTQHATFSVLTVSYFVAESAINCNLRSCIFAKEIKMDIDQCHGEQSVVKEYVCNIHSSCPGMAFIRASIIQQQFKENGIKDMLAPCTYGRTARCWITESLSVWNGVLHPAGVLLREFLPGDMALTSVAVVDEVLPQSSALLDACFTVYWLLRQHQCVKAIHLDDTVLLLQCPSVFGLCLANNGSVKSVKMSLRLVNEYHAKLLTNGFQRMKQLESLQLTHVSLSRESVSRLAKFLRATTCLQTLSLRRNQLSRKSFETIFEALKDTTCLTTLEVHGQDVPLRHVLPLVKFLSANRTVKEASFRGINRGISAILQCLRDNCVVTKLELANCTGTDDTAEILYEVLTKNSTLRSLKFPNCDFTSRCVVAISDVLRENSTLQRLAFSVKTCDGSAFVTLAEALAQNKTLCTLFVSSEKTMADESLQLVACLAANSSLEVLELNNAPSVSNTVWGTRILTLATASGVFERVRIKWDTPSFCALSSVVAASNTLRELCLADIETCQPRSLAPLISSLTRNTSVSKLIIGDTAALRGSAASALADVFRENTTLKHVELSAWCDSSDTSTIMRGLIDNKSISYLKTSLKWSEKLAVEALADVLLENTTLNVLVLKNFCLDDNTLHVFLRGLMKNVTVSDMEVTWSGASEYGDLLPVMNIVCRNECMLNQAALFVLQKSHDDLAVESFKRVHHCDSLLWRLQKVNAWSKGEVRSAVNNARSRLNIATQG
ncbi:uncharacterized protein LOC135398341 [Ornithodoros turicata]|uniref:uncharacterized protein LOC135398341 n=1 Tax=Ornithodoros turicata TaxID=34597 RepID=UPI0031397745